MDVFADLIGISESELHPKFKLLRDEFSYKWARKVVEVWASDFFDRDNKIATEFQKQFHPALWELYLNAVLRSLGLPLCEEYDRPDFIVGGDDGFYIEAVVSEIKKGGVPESRRTLRDQQSMLFPISSKQEFSNIIDEAIVRHSNSITNKLKKYTGYFDEGGKWKKGYKECDWVDEGKPYIVALGSYDQINYGKEYIYSMMALLHGLYFDPETGSFSKKECIEKPSSESKIEIGLFHLEAFADVSAILFSNTMTLGKLSSLSKSSGFDPSWVINVRYDFDYPHFKIHEVSERHPEMLLDGLYLFPNPNANVRFSNELLARSGILTVTVDDVGLAMEGWLRPIVARYCAPEVLVLHQKEEIKAIAASSYNNTIAYDIS